MVFPGYCRHFPAERDRRGKTRFTGLFGTGVRSHGRRAFAHNSLGNRSNPKQEKDPAGDGARFLFRASVILVSTCKSRHYKTRKDFAAA